MKKRKIQFGSVLIGMVVALAIILSQGFSGVEVNRSKAEIKTEQSDQDANGTSSEQVNFVLASSSLPSSVQIQLNQDTVFLFEILFEEIETKDYFHNLHHPLIQFFRILLGATIAPNAP